MEWSEESAEESVALKREQTPQAKCFFVFVNLFGVVKIEENKR